LSSSEYSEAKLNFSPLQTIVYDSKDYDAYSNIFVQTPQHY